MSRDDEQEEAEGGPYLTQAEYKAFKRHVDGLNKLIMQVRERYPEAQYYLACSMGARLHILTDSSHEGPRCDARQDRIIKTLQLRFADGGDW